MVHGRQTSPVELERRLVAVEASAGRRLPALAELVTTWLRCGQAVIALNDGVKHGPPADRRSAWAEDMLYHEENFVLRVQRFGRVLDAAAVECGAGADFVARARAGGVAEPWARAADAARQLHSPLLRHLTESPSLTALRRVREAEPSVDVSYVSMVLDELLPIFEELYTMTEATLAAAARALQRAP